MNRKGAKNASTLQFLSWYRLFEQRWTTLSPF